MLNFEKIIPNEDANIDEDDDEVEDDGDEAEMKFQDKLILKMSHQMEENHKQMQQFFKYQSQHSEKLFKKISEFVDCAKILISNKDKDLDKSSPLDQSSVDETPRLKCLKDKISKLRNSSSILSNKTNNDPNESSEEAELNSNKNNQFASTFSTESNSSMNFNESNIIQADDSNQSMNEENTCPNSTKPSTSDSKKSSKSNSEAEYQKFKEKYESLIEKRILKTFRNLDFNEMRSNEEAKKANVPQALNEINSNIKEINILKIE